MKIKVKNHGINLIQNVLRTIKWTVISMIIAVVVVFIIIVVARVYEYF